MDLEELAEISAVKIVSKPRVVGLPRKMVVEYFGEVRGTQFIIYRPRDEWDYKDFVCLVARPQKSFSPVNIIRTTRYRDGGTTDIELEGGAEFHFPSPLYQEAKKPATFNGEPITLYDLDF